MPRASRRPRLSVIDSKTMPMWVAASHPVMNTPRPVASLRPRLPPSEIGLPVTTPNAGTSKEMPGASGSASTASSKAAEPIDINFASEKELANLPKIGAVKAKAIVKNRPYSGKDALVDKKILSQNEYDAIKGQIIAK